MMTREQVQDLRPGDVVEYSGPAVLQGAKIIGPLVGDATLTVGGWNDDPRRTKAEVVAALRVAAVRADIR